MQRVILLRNNKIWYDSVLLNGGAVSFRHRLKLQCSEQVKYKIEIFFVDIKGVKDPVEIAALQLVVIIFKDIDSQLYIGFLRVHASELDQHTFADATCTQPHWFKSLNVVYDFLNLSGINQLKVLQ